MLISSFITTNNDGMSSNVNLIHKIKIKFGEIILNRIPRLNGYQTSYSITDRKNAYIFKLFSSSWFLLFYSRIAFSSLVLPFDIHLPRIRSSSVLYNAKVDSQVFVHNVAYTDCRCDFHKVRSQSPIKSTRSVFFYNVFNY